MSQPMDVRADENFRTSLVAVLPRLRRFCASVSGGLDAGDDLLQATVERALARAHQWQAGTRLDSWLFRIAQNISIDWARSRKSHGTQVPVEELEHQAGEDGRATVEQRSQLAAVRRAMASLPEEQRMVLTLVVIDGMAYREAAEFLGVPTGTIMSRLGRARSAIDRFLNGQEPGKKTNA